jgi:triacylglycerol lipase
MSPTLATDLGELPPSFIAIGTQDLFVDENIDYAQRLIQAGVPTELKVYNGGYHVFEYKVPDADISRRARRDHYVALRLAFQ